MLANPNLISQAVLKNSLDSQTAFEIVSIDIADIDAEDLEFWDTTSVRSADIHIA